MYVRTRQPVPIHSSSESSIGEVDGSQLPSSVNVKRSGNVVSLMHCSLSTCSLVTDQAAHTLHDRARKAPLRRITPVSYKFTFIILWLTRQTTCSIWRCSTIAPFSYR